VSITMELKENGYVDFVPAMKQNVKVIKT
jgi:hypothetical protein